MRRQRVRVRPGRPQGLTRLVLAAVVTASLVLATADRGNPADTERPTFRQLVGQRLVVALQGTAPSPALLGRVRRGEVAGVILFGGNVAGATQVRALTGALQAAAREGGQPRLLVAVDQEGGEIRRLPWAGPSLSTERLGRGTSASVRAQARAAGLALRAVGVNTNLAPVADVPVPGSFMAAEQRTFSSDSARVGELAAAFAAGLADARIVAAVKHFPGIGRAIRSTDRTAVSIDATRTALARDLAPFRRVISDGVPVVMLSNATYSAYGLRPAPWSSRIQALLRGTLGFEGVTVTDAFEPAALTRQRGVASTAVLAAQAGVDLILLTGSEAASAAVFDRLLESASVGAIPRASLQRSYDRVAALKQRLG